MVGSSTNKEDSLTAMFWRELEQVAAVDLLVASDRKRTLVGI